MTGLFLSCLFVATFLIFYLRSLLFVWKRRTISSASRCQAPLGAMGYTTSCCPFHTSCWLWPFNGCQCLPSPFNLCHLSPLSKIKLATLYHFCGAPKNYCQKPL